MKNNYWGRPLLPKILGQFKGDPLKLNGQFFVDIRS